MVTLTLSGSTIILQDSTPIIGADVINCLHGAIAGNGDEHIACNPVNMFWRMYERNMHQYNNKLISSIALTYTPTNYLDITGRIGLDFDMLEVEQKNNPTKTTGIEGGLYSHRLGKQKVQDYQILATLHKDGIFIPKLNASFALGAESWKRRDYDLWATNSRRWSNPYIWAFSNYDLQGNNANMSSLLPSEDRYEKQINSVYGNLEVNWDNFIYLQVTGRNDWSSTLPSNKNSYFYPSVNAGFVFNQLLGFDWLTFGKLRVAYATSANDTDPYQLLPTYESGSFAGNPAHSVKPDLPPVKLEPQYVHNFDAGINLKFLESRIKFDFTYYITHAYNQIMSAPLPNSSGYTSYKFNTGELENKGFELELGADIVRSKDLDWNMTLNLAHNQNKLLSLDGETKSLFVGHVWDDTHNPVMKVTVGQKYGCIYGWDYERDDKGNKIVNVVYGKGEYANKVIGTTYRTTKEQVLLGNATPDVTGGLNTTVRWKSFTLYALADFSFGGDIWSGDYATALQAGISPATLKERDGGGLPYTYGDGTTANHGIIMDGVLADGTKNTNVVHYTWKYGRVGSWGGNASQNQLTTPSIVKDNWIKMREISLTWNVPYDLVKLTKVFQSAQLSITGRDLFYIHSSVPDDINPEALSAQTGNAQGLMFGALPGVRSFTFGVKFGF
jgi:iron complex outermembrane receptor protein